MTPSLTPRLLQLAMLTACFSIPLAGYAQTKIDPGYSAENEFTRANQTHTYTVQMRAGEHLIIHVIPIGAILKTEVSVSAPEPSGILIARTVYQSGKQELLTDELSADGRYTIAVTSQRYHYGEFHVGKYTISLGKIDSNGSEIAPGSLDGTVGARGGGQTPGPTLESLQAETHQLRKQIAQLQTRIEMLEKLLRN